MRWWSPRRVVAPALGGRKVIFLGPACGHVAHCLGFMDVILSDVELRDAILERGAVFGGVSSGAHLAAFSMASVHGVRSLHDWYAQDVRRGYERIGRRSVMVMGDEVFQAGLRYHRTCSDALDGDIPWLDCFPLSVTLLPTLQARFQTSFSSAEEFALAIKATSFVPGFMGLKPWVRLQDCRVFDGYTGTLRAALPDNYLFVSFLPNMPLVARRSKHVLRIEQYDTTASSFFVKTWPWGDPFWADAAFERGRGDARMVHDEVCAKFMLFLSQGRVSRK